MRRLRRGIFLITTLMLIVFLTMLATTLLVSAMTGWTTTASYVNKKQAGDAGLSGLTFVQALLESNIQTLAPAPNGVAANTTITSTDGTVQVVMKGWSIVGWIANTDTIGSGEQPLYMMFQACFNNNYNAFTAPTTPPLINGIQLPPCPYVSINNLNRTSQVVTNITQSYTASGAIHEAVQGQRADVIVIGYVVSADGQVLSSRTVEGMLDVGQIGGFAGTAAAAQGNISLISGNLITVGANGTAPPGFMGLSSFAGNIDPQGTAAPVGGATAPPNYMSGSKVALNGSSTFQYTQGGGGTTNYTGTDAQMGAPAPPTVNAADLPALQNQVSVPAGTYVVWGTPAAVYHYPYDYDATNGATPPTAVPVQNQAWLQPDTTKPPTLNGIAPDMGPMQSLDTGGVIKLTPSPAAPSVAGNSFTVTSNDISVTPIAGINSFTVLVAPTANVAGTPIVGSAAPNGSAQLVFSPTASGQSLQLRSTGNVNIMGNVTGSGSVQATGTNAATNLPADINVLGKSALDTRSDTGIALYSDGQTNVFGLVDANNNTIADLPSNVTQYAGMVGQNNVGGGGGGGSNISTLTQAEYAVVAQALVANGQGPSINMTGGAPNPFGGNQSNNLASQPVAVTYNSVSYSGSLIDVLYWMENNQPQGSAVPNSWKQQGTSGGINNGSSSGPPANGSIQDIMEEWTGTYNTNNPPTGTDAAQWTVSKGGSQVTIKLPSADLSSYATSGVPTSGGSSPSPSPSASSSASASPLPSFDQTFNGLVYAGSTFDFSTASNFTVNGALVANTGQINLSGNNITLQYDSSLAGQFANLFSGGRVLLERNSVTIY